MTLEERAKEIVNSSDIWKNFEIQVPALERAIVAALQYAQAEAYAKAAKQVEQLSYDIRSLAMGDKP